MIESEVQDIIGEVVEIIKERHGFDFSEYKARLLFCRLEGRLERLGFHNNQQAYLDYLENNQAECARLVDLFFINHTCFFRDREVWNGLKARILPQLLAAKDPAGPIRVWCAGCSSGEEVYSLAMTLSQLMGQEEFQRRVTIYATDVDHAALKEARQACYNRELVEQAVPSALLETFFEAKPSSRELRFRQELICPIHFSQHNLLMDAPLERINLLFCRNVLIYFNRTSWHRVLNGFGQALIKNGVLVLGKAEWPILFSTEFAAVDSLYQVYTKTKNWPL